MTLKDKLHLNRNNNNSTAPNTTNTAPNTDATSKGGKLRNLLHRSKSGSNINQGAAQVQPGPVLPAQAVTQTTTQAAVTQTTTTTTTAQTASLTQDLPASYDQLIGPPQMLPPVVVEEYVEYQPIIHRVIEAPQVQRIERHSFEVVPSSGPTQITQPTIIQETIRPRVTEEVQPIIHREVSQPQIERIEQHITERMIQPTTYTKEVVNDNLLRQQQFSPAGGAPLQQNTGSAGTTTNSQQNGPISSARTSAVWPPLLHNI